MELKAYIDVEGRKRRKLIEPTLIEINRVEGPHYLCDKPQKFTRYSAVNSWLLLGSYTAPKGGAYDKHDFKVTFEDGYEYSGRFDLHHTEYGGMPRLQEHMLGYIEFLARDERAGRLYGEQIVKDAQRLLETHDFGQRPPVLMDDDQTEIVRDYRTQPVTDAEIKARVDAPGRVPVA